MMVSLLNTLTIEDNILCLWRLFSGY